jgi:hypothetical protein
VFTAVTQAQTGKLPLADSLEPNDGAGEAAVPVWGRRGKTLHATIDFWDDQSDVYALRLRAHERVFASLRGPAGTKLILWRPGTTQIDGLSPLIQRMRVSQSRQRGIHERFAYRVPARRGGWYFLQVKSEAPGGGRYTLSFVKTRR